MKKYIIILMLLIGCTAISQKHRIQNNTDKEYLDAVIDAGLDSLEIGKVRVIIRPLKYEAVADFESRFNSTLQGYIRGQGKLYIIYIGDYSKQKTIEIISHELIHLKQYYNHELYMVEDDVYYKDGIYRRAKHIRYSARPWERDAHREGWQLYRKLRNNKF
jgi:hypothetical protein